MNKSEKQKKTELGTPQRWGCRVLLFLCRKKHISKKNIKMILFSRLVLTKKNDGAILRT
ncbi:MAG: hypothetical protein ACI4DR_08155 [Roseburia sp.]